MLATIPYNIAYNYSVETYIYFLKLRMSIRRNNAGQQQNNEMKSAYSDTFNASHGTVTNRDYIELGEINNFEPSYVNMDARGLV